MPAERIGMRNAREIIRLKFSSVRIQRVARAAGRRRGWLLIPKPAAPRVGRAALRAPVDFVGETTGRAICRSVPVSSRSRGRSPNNNRLCGGPGQCPVPSNGRYHSTAGGPERLA
jgi:hypothetical protein